MTNHPTDAEMVAAATHVHGIWIKAQELAKLNLGKGKKFIGANGVADALGFERGSHDWEIASHAAYNVFKHATIVTDPHGVQV